LPEKKNPGRNKPKSNPMGSFKYGVQVPRTVHEALDHDKQNANHLCADASKKEIGTLWTMGTFKHVAKGKFRKVKQSHQFAPLWVIVDIEQDQQRKARLVSGTHIVDASAYNTFASNMKTTSARLLLTIASTNKLNVLVGDIQSA
jgi:hypothetical protein